jgi:MFS transporter, PAT family, solute carrier family 33 (acetyl-CoA transportor), member 1
MSLILFYLSGTIEEMLEHRQVYTITALFMMMIFVVTCQDIAVDSLAIEILHPSHTSFASTCQSVGFKVGIFTSTSMFIALHSVEFCNNYIYSVPKLEPVLPLKTFMLMWSQF